MLLPTYQASDQTFMLMQTRWSAILNPILSNPLIQGNLLEKVVLAIGATVISHKLGRKPQGWIITDINASATVYRSAAFNDLTLTLTSSAVATVNLYIF